MTAYTASEKLEPDLVVIEKAFTRLPEFEMLRSLLSTLDIIVLLARPGQDPSQGGAPKPVKEINMNDDPSRTAYLMVTALSSTKSNTLRIPEGIKPIRSGEPFVLIGTSTGGIEALTCILSQYPALCPPTLIVQHTGDNFGTSLVNLLDKACPARVLKAKGRMPLEKGTIYLAAGGNQHIALSSDTHPTAEIVPGTKVTGHIPSINVLFHSAVQFAQFCVAGILTGMGKDGVDGLLALRNAGAKTFAQDEQSSVVYGMPRVAMDVGAAESQVGLQETTGHILRSVDQIETGRSENGI